MQKNLVLLFLSLIFCPPCFAGRGLSVYPMEITSFTQDQTQQYQGAVIGGQVKVYLSNLSPKPAGLTQTITVKLGNETLASSIGDAATPPNSLACPDPNWHPFLNLPCGQKHLYSFVKPSARSSTTFASQTVQFTGADDLYALRTVYFQMVCGLTNNGIDNCTYDPSAAALPASPLSDLLVSIGVTYDFQLSISVLEDRGAISASVFANPLISSAGSGAGGTGIQQPVNGGRPF